MGCSLPSASRQLVQPPVLLYAPQVVRPRDRVVLHSRFHRRLAVCHRPRHGQVEDPQHAQLLAVCHRVQHLHAAVSREQAYLPGELGHDAAAWWRLLL